MVKAGTNKKKEKAQSSEEEESSSESEEEVVRPRKTRRRAAAVVVADSDDEDDVDYVFSCLPSAAAPLIEFANASQGILLLLMLKQHLKNLCGFSDRYLKH